MVPNTTLQRPLGAAMTTLRESGRHVLEPIAPGDFSQMMETYKKAVAEAENAACRDFRKVIDLFFETDADKTYFRGGASKTNQSLYHDMSAALRRDAAEHGRDKAAENLTARIVAAIKACPETDEAIYI